MAYERHPWVDDADPPLDATVLTEIEDGIVNEEAARIAGDSDLASGLATRATSEELAAKADLVDGTVPTAQLPAVTATPPATYDAETQTIGVTTGTSSGTVAAGDDSRIIGAAQTAANLSDLASPSAARASLGLGTAAVAATSDFDASGAADAAQVAAVQRANHTGTQAESTIVNLVSDLAAKALASDLATEASTARTAEGLAAQKASNLTDLADASAARTALGLGTAATQASTAFDAAGAAAAAQAASQPLDSDLTAFAALSTTSYGRALLALADAAAGRTALGLGTAAVAATGDFDAAGAAAAAQAAAVQRSNHTGTQAESTVVGLVSDLAAKADLVAGLVPTAQLPAIVISDTFPVASEAAMLALTAQRGDVAIRSDLSKSYILSTDSPTTLADWKELLSPASPVASVNGRVGSVTGLAENTDLTSEISRATAGEAAAQAASQPLDSDLTAIAALTTTSYGRALLALADAAAGRTALGLGTAAVAAIGDFAPAGGIAESAVTNLVSDLAAKASAASVTAEAATARTAEALAAQKASNLTDLADASAARTALGLGTAATQASTAFDASGAAAAAQAASQPLDSDLTAIAALTTTSYGRALLALADAAAGRTALALGTAAVSATGDFEAAAGHTSNSVPAASGSTSLADLAMGASTILARLAAGNIVAATPDQLKTLLAIAQADVSGLTAALALLAPLASPTFTGVAAAPSLSASGKTGATNQATILAGGTASGAPSTGAHIVGELVLDATGAAWYCTVAGTPGTWVQIGGHATLSNNLGSPATITPANTYVALLTVALTPGTWEVSANVYVGSAPGGNLTVKLWDGTTVLASNGHYNGIATASISVPIVPVIITVAVNTTITLAGATDGTSTTVPAALATNGTGTTGTVTRITAVRLN